MWNLSDTWKNQGQDMKALELLQTCVQLQHHKPGPSHPNTLFATDMLNGWQLYERHTYLQLRMLSYQYKLTC
ncbi:hypothetical protein BDV59DRAFT_177467 [Aspergillus ambiguus]|uniref:uncharacterized protein n=1 Tax=Aspergillus ambiguus TaxID=176160 RepID=UPI003CCCA3EE